MSDDVIEAQRMISVLVVVSPGWHRTRGGYNCLGGEVMRTELR